MMAGEGMSSSCSRKVQIGCWAIQVCGSGVRGVEWAG